MTNTKTVLYLDDVRTPTETMPGYKPWAVVRNYDQFVKWVTENGVPNYVSLDHDLADEHMADYFNFQARGIQAIHYSHFKEKTGVDCISWLLSLVYDQMQEGKTPNLETVGVHSHNPIGAENMYHIALNFAKHNDWKGEVFYKHPPFIVEKS